MHFSFNAIWKSLMEIDAAVEDGIRPFLQIKYRPMSVRKNSCASAIDPDSSFTAVPSIAMSWATWKYIFGP